MPAKHSKPKNNVGTYANENLEENEDHYLCDPYDKNMFFFFTTQYSFFLNIVIQKKIYLVQKAKKYDWSICK